MIKFFIDLEPKGFINTMFQLPRERKGSVQPKPAKANARKFYEFLNMNFMSSTPYA